MCSLNAICCRVLCVAVAWLAVPPASFAQPASPREELLALVPADVGLCLVIGDLRGHAQKWERSAWAQALRQSPLVKALVDSPEAGQIAALEGELKKHLGVDWPTLRDDILGDAVVFAYRPGAAARPDQEQGMVAVRAARPKLLAGLVDRFNLLQKDSGELKSLDAVQHQGATYFRRGLRRTHWYYLHGPLLIVAGDEDMLRHAIERDLGKAADTSPWPARFRRAGAEQSLAALGINPRAFELFPKPAAGEKPQGFPALWRALDGILVTLSADQSIEVRLSLQGRPADMPPWARALFSETPAPSLLWQRFPEQALLTIAARNDFANLAEQFLAVLPPADRDNLKNGLSGLGKLIQLDLFRDVLPNVGPDWGVCVLPPADGATYPQVIAALAVKAGSGADRLDDALLKVPQILADLYKVKNPAAPPRIETIKQGKVIVKVLVQDGLVPAGVRPAWAVKDGFLLFASSPEAIARFGLRDTAAPIKGETPLLRVSPLALGQFLKHRRAEVLLDLQKKNQLTLPEAERNFDQLLGLLDLFESITFSQRSEPGQASWVLRVQPRMKP
jgi:hypothetical protein